METISLTDWYKTIGTTIPEEISKEIGHFNVFKNKEVVAQFKTKKVMPYNTRAFYKISLINGSSTSEYADKVIEIKNNGLLFATPKVPYHWTPNSEKQGGYFCIFTDEFLIRNKSGVVLDDLPIFKPGGYPVFELTEEESAALTAIFVKK
ncbi:hypothetical protein [uncultured Mucilaginibacter sp.]|uniref:hypothetical protein n=1 Tax=uncultured Mucilaginibacter sp. TaxID=797541 RepID=UPI00260F2EAB|nr:hypothetical protein [uncultured Mucilaginibacter sp.]